MMVVSTMLMELILNLYGGLRRVRMASMVLLVRRLKSSMMSLQFTKIVIFSSLQPLKNLLIKTMQIVLIVD